MPSGIYIRKPHTEEWNENIGKANLGRKHSEETKQKMSLAKIGKKRRTRTKEHCKNLSKSLTGKKKSQKHCENMSKALKGRISPFKGKKHTQSAKEKNRQAHIGKEKTEKTRKILSLKNKGQKRTESQKQSIKIGSKIAHNKKDAKENHSNAMSKRIVEKNFNPNSHHKHGYFFSTLNNREFYYRSSYELEAYKLLDDEDSKSIIKSWDTEPFKVAYKDEKITKHTVPDIFIEYKSGKKQLISVKPNCFLKDKDILLKHQAMEKYCIENNIVFSIWTEKELGIQ